MSRGRWTAGAGLLLCWCAACPAGEPLDDSLSPRVRVRVDAEWVHDARLHRLTDAQLHRRVARVPGYEVRLRTADYVGRRARIFLVLPASQRGLRRPDSLRMRWRAQGRFESGTATPGQRALLYEGVVAEPVLSDVLDIEILFDTRDVAELTSLEWGYEIETR